MSDRKHIKRDFNASVTKRMRYNYDDFRVDIYQFDKSQEKRFTAPSSVKNGVKINSSHYPLYQAKDILSPMELTFDFHPQKAGTYRLELLYMNTHTTASNYTNSVSKSLSKSAYSKLASSFSSYCSSHHKVPQYLTSEKTNFDFRALLYGFATALSGNSLPANVTFSNSKFNKTIEYQKNLNSNSSVKRTDILKEAKALKTYIDKHKTAPSKVKVGSKYVSISQFAYLMSRAIKSTSATFSIINCINGSCYMKDNANFKITVDGKSVKSKLISNGFDVIHSRNYAYVKITQKQVDKYKQVDKTPLKIKCSFTSANTGFFALVIKKYKLWQGDKYNEDGHELTIKSMDIQLTNKLDVDTATVNLMYWHGLDDETKLNLSGYIFDYRDEINIFIKNNAGVMEQVFGGYISVPSVSDDLTTMTLNCANRLIDLDHRTSLSEIYMNSTADVSEYKEKYDYTKNCNNWSSPLKFLCDYAEIPLNTNVSDSKPLVRNKILKQIKYGTNKDCIKSVTTKHMGATINKSSITLRNNPETNITQSVRIFDDELMKVKDKIVINDYPNLWIDYGLGATETTTKMGITDIGSTTTKGSSKPCPNRGNSADYSKAIYKLANNATNLCYVANNKEHNKDLCKQIVEYVKKKYPYKSYFNSKYSANYLAKHVGHGCNCVDHAKLVLTLCSAKGIPHKELWYRNGSYNSAGTAHVLCDIYGVIADAATSTGGWGKVIKGYSKGKKYAQFNKAWRD